MRPTRIVLLTAGSLESRQLANLLDHAGVKFDIVTFAYPAPAGGSNSALRLVSRRAIAFFKSVRAIRSMWQARLPRFPRKVRYTGYCNSDRMIRALRELAPDYIVMMGGCILSTEAIVAARIGVLNAHPGLLPWARGMNVMEHSLLREIPLGATGHFIDVGIDTGPIVLRYLLPVENETSTASLRSSLDDLCLGIMFEMITRVARGERLAAELQGERFPYCRRVSVEESKRAEGLARDGKARDLYLKWRSEHGSIPDGSETLRRIRSELQSDTGPFGGKRNPAAVVDRTVQ